MNKIIKYLLSIVVVSAIIVGCSKKMGDSGVMDDKNINSSELKDVTITFVVSPLNVPSIIEKENQFFSKKLKEIGVSLEYAEINSGADQTQALASGSVQILNCVGATSVILSASNNADIKILGMYGRSPEAFMLISKDESINTASDLKGKIIAGPMGTNLHQLLISYLSANGMSIEDVEYINMSIPDAKAALDGGSIDVALLAGPIAYKALKSGYNEVANGEGYISAQTLIATTQKFYDEHKDIINLFRESQKDIELFMKNNHEQTVEIVAKALDLDKESIEDMYKMYDFRLDVSKEDIKGLQETVIFMKANNMIENDVNIEDLIIK